MTLAHARSLLGSAGVVRPVSDRSSPALVEPVSDRSSLRQTAFHAKDRSETGPPPNPLPVHELPYSPAADAAALESLAEWAMAFSPLVAADPPGGLLLDIAGVEHLFGGEAALLAKLGAGLRELGLSPRIAVAPTLGAAWALARFAKASGLTVQDGVGILPANGRHGSRPLPGRVGSVHHSWPDQTGGAGGLSPPCELGPAARERISPARESMSPRYESMPPIGGPTLQRASCTANPLHDALRPLPIAGLRLEASYVASLREVGIERIGQLLDISRRDLGLRFGALLLRRLDQALGDVAETLESVRLRETPAAQRVFDGPVVDAETIRRTARELLDSLLARLASQGLGALQLSLEFLRIDAGPRSIELQLTHPSTGAAHLWSLLSPRLERISLGYGVEALSLVALRTGRTSAVQSFIWQDVSSDGAATTRDEGELLDRLAGRLGAEAVARCALVERHIPEAAFAFHAVYEEGEAGILPANGRHGNRPLPAAALALATVAPKRPAGGRPHIEDRPCAEGRPHIRKGRAIGNREFWHAARAPLRPMVLFETPEPLRVIALHPDGSPVRIWWRGVEIAIRRGLGPERIAPPWWSAAEQRASRLLDRHLSNEQASRRTGTAPFRSVGTAHSRRVDTARHSLPDRNAGDGGQYPFYKTHAYAERRENMPPDQSSDPNRPADAFCGPRDYFLLLDSYGRCLWVYRAAEAGQWYLHGVFS